MQFAIREAVASYVTTVLACALIARRRLEARAEGLHVGNVAPIPPVWLPLYTDWISGLTVQRDLDLCCAISGVTGVPAMIVDAILATVQGIPADHIRTVTIVERCQLAALHVLVGPLGGIQP